MSGLKEVPLIRIMHESEFEQSVSTSYSGHLIYEDDVDAAVV
jgi:hypothetical protein